MRASSGFWEVVTQDGEIYLADLDEMIFTLLHGQNGVRRSGLAYEGQSTRIMTVLRCAINEAARLVVRDDRTSRTRTIRTAPVANLTQL